MIEIEIFETHMPMQKIQRIKSNLRKIKIDRYQISSFTNPTKINKKNAIKTYENGKVTIKPQLLRTTSAESEWGEGSSTIKEELKEDDKISVTIEMSRTSFKPARHNVD